MRFTDIEKIKSKLQEDIVSLQIYDEEDQYIDANFQQFLRNGEYDDNSMDLCYFYNRIKEIEIDGSFIRKMTFVLSHYAKGASSY